MKLLFVCSGNTCRSPLALAAWRALSCPAIGVEATSAGLFAAPGAAASNSVVKIARDWNVDLSRHRARTLDEKLLRDSDLICVMTPEHERHLIELGTKLRIDIEKRVVLLGQFAAWSSDDDETSARHFQSLLADTTLADTTFSKTKPKTLDAALIADPFGGSHEAYQSCAAHIRRAVDGLSRAIKAGHFAA